MSRKIDHIIKTALENFEVSGKGDWEAFYEMWKAKESFLDENLDDDSVFDSSIQATLGDLEHTGASDWTSFAALMESMETEARQNKEQEFDEKIKTALEEYSEFPINQNHWKSFSHRLNQLNNRPRMILIKVAEVAAVIFILFHLSQFYSDYLWLDHGTETISTITDQTTTSEENNKELSVPPNHLELSTEDNLSTSEGLDKDRTESSSEDFLSVNGDENINPVQPLEKSKTKDLKIEETNPNQNTTLATSLSIEPAKKTDFPEKLPHAPAQIEYKTSVDRTAISAKPLALQDINLMQIPSSGDSLLSMNPTFQTIRPKLHSMVEAGIFADATNVQIQNAYSFSNTLPRNEIKLNPGLFVRYKLMYKNLFGAIGADYVGIEYSGMNHPNEIALLSLPFELGYNIVNISTFRFYIGGGIAGRFVPVSRYSSESFNLASDYNKLETAKKTNGLLNNGPFEINSYLSGRYCIGFDTNFYQNLTIGLRYTHDFWLKGQGIGFNYDRFKSSHLAFSLGYQF